MLFILFPADIYNGLIISEKYGSDVKFDSCLPLKQNRMQKQPPVNPDPKISILQF